ncbi:hypothetical protein H8L32_26530 [Undibacterium sp. CY18W]|uniref:Uncharacterized protein n=1 Tax=Undibacterium hunanense TaxID=2762292 RepID=A0ABR6ZYU3_9BURK|nr:DUF6463 family protein [Undibacterium hunanense]MBC3921047.1 hypothetical protein [Undibacterium hunanense]
MSAQTSPRKIWIGRYLMAVAALHTIVAILIYGPVFMGMLERGIFNTVNRDPLRSAAIWFLLFGGPLLLLGMNIHNMERKQDFTEAGTMGLGILICCLFGIVLMPVSGFWLAMPAAIALINRRSNQGQTA